MRRLALRVSAPYYTLRQPASDIAQPAWTHHCANPWTPDKRFFRLSASSARGHIGFQLGKCLHGIGESRKGFLAVPRAKNFVGARRLCLAFAVVIIGHILLLHSERSEEHTSELQS